MKKLFVGALLLIGATTAEAEVGVAVSIGQPGFYGQILVGDVYPAPKVVYPQPIIIQQPQVAVVQQPMYLRVPSWQMKKWSRYCGRYGACGRQVYFVRDNWYQRVYAPRYNAYAARHGRHGDHHRLESHTHHQHDHDHDHGRHSDRGWGLGNHRGHGHDRD